MIKISRLESNVHGKRAAHDILVNFDANDAGTTERWIAVLHLDDCRDELRGKVWVTN